MNGQIGQIKNICFFDMDESNRKIYIFYEEITRQNSYFHSTREVTVNNIEECTITNNLHVCKPDMIKEPCIKTKVKDREYIIRIPQGCHGD